MDCRYCISFIVKQALSACNRNICLNLRKTWTPFHYVSDGSHKIRGDGVNNTSLPRSHDVVILSHTIRCKTSGL
jgi:hypothetical protein